MSPDPIIRNISEDDLSARFQRYTTVDASPSAGSETVIATLTLSGFGGLSVVSGVDLHAWAAFTVGTNGVSVRLRIRQTDGSGTVVGDTGAVTGGVTAGNLMAVSVDGFDATPAKKVYALTLTVGSGSAASTVSALMLRAVIV